MRKKIKDRWRKPNDDMVRARQVPKLAIAFRTWWTEHRGRWDYMGERIGIEGLINAFIADFMDWPLEERIAFVDRAVPKAEKLEREWYAEMDKKLAAGEIEPEFPYRTIKPVQPSLGGLEQTGPAGLPVVLDDTHGTRNPPVKRNRPKRRA